MYWFSIIQLWWTRLLVIIGIGIFIDLNNQWRGFFTFNIMSWTNRDSFYFFLPNLDDIYLTWLKPLKEWWTSSKNGYPCLGHDLTGRVFSLSHLLNVVHHGCFINRLCQMELILLLVVCYMFSWWKGVGFFQMLFMLLLRHVFFPFILLLCCFTLIYLCIWINLAFSG